MAVDAPKAVDGDAPPQGDAAPKQTLEQQYEKAAEAAGVDLSGEGEEASVEADAAGNEPVVENSDGAAVPEEQEGDNTGAEVPGFVLPDDADERANILAGIKNLPETQKWLSDATAKAANTATEKATAQEREKAQTELQELLNSGDPRAQQAMKSAEQKSADELVALGRAANTLYDATVNLLADTYELDRTELKQTAEVPSLIAKVIEGLDAKRVAEYDAKLKSGIESGIRALRDKERGGRPAPSRDASIRSSSPPVARGGSLAEYYEQAVAAQERGN